MSNPESLSKVDPGTGTITIVTAAEGVVEYEWAVADTATAGRFDGEFVVTDGGVPLVTPGQGFIKFEVIATLT